MVGLIKFMLNNNEIDSSFYFDIKKTFLLLTLAFTTPAIFADVYYISPNGDDDNSGKNEQSAWKTFSYSLSEISSGDELVLLDGLYSHEVGTGGIHWNTKKYPDSGQIPSGLSLEQQTIVRAYNPGNVLVDVPLFIGRKKRKDSYIRIEGVTFNGGHLYNTSYITIKNTGFSDRFVIGTKDHSHDNNYNLIEDVWIWASQRRIVSMNYRSNKNVWRRVVVRGDGCNKKQCTGSGNPNVGFTVYDSSDVSVQNVIVLDRILGGGKSYADFATAQHTRGKNFLGRNEWLGIISVNSEDNGLVFEADNVIPDVFTWKIVNALVLDAKRGGINIGNKPYNAITPNVVENSTVILSKQSSIDGIRLSPGQNISHVANNIVVNAGRYAINSASEFSHVITHNAKSSHYNQAKCTSGCYKINPFNPVWSLWGPELKEPTKIEENSHFKGKGLAGKDIGANIVYRYGIDGSRFGDDNFNVLTNIKLWPWPHEQKILSQICLNRKSPVCLSSEKDKNIKPSISNYINNYLNTHDLK